MSKIISQLEFWLILFALAAGPNWPWPVFGSVEESRMIVLGLAAGGLALLETLNVIAGRPQPRILRGEGRRSNPGVDAMNFGIASSLTSFAPRNDSINFGFFKNPLNWIISAPFLLVAADWLKTVITAPSSVIPAKAGIQFSFYQFFGFGIPWHTAVLPVFLLLAWHFLLRAFFAGDGKKPLLKFAFAWIIIAALIALVRGLLSSPYPLLGEERGPGNIGPWFAIASILALALSALCLPLAAPSLSPPLTKGGIKGGLRLGRLIYFLYAVLLAAIVFFIQFEVRIARAARFASQNDFAAARRLNPYYPEYALSWAESEIDNLGKADLTADVTASKQKVGEIAKGLEGLMSLRGAERRINPGINAMNSGIASSAPGGLAMTLRVARAWENLGKFAEGANERALAIYDALIASSGDNADSSLIIKKALLLEKSGKANEAIEWLQSAVILEQAASMASGAAIESSIDSIGRRPPNRRTPPSRMTDNPEIRYHLGRLLYNSGKEDEARDIWLAILKDEPDYSDVNYSLGAYFARQKNYSQARRYFNKVLELNPQNADIKKKIDELGRKR